MDGSYRATRMNATCPFGIDFWALFSILTELD